MTAKQLLADCRDGVTIAAQGFDSTFKGNSIMSDASKDDSSIRTQSLFQGPVPATACLWFSFAPQGMQPGPFGENETHRPVSVPIAPEGGVLDVAANGLWRHGPSDNQQSGPDGLATVENQDLRYQDDKYNSKKINAIACNLCKLVGIFEINNGPPPVNTDPFRIGSAMNGIVIPQNATKFLLGFHDGYEWNNNSGSVNVTVTQRTFKR